MSWKNLLQPVEQEIILPWVGGRIISLGPRTWKLEGKLPAEFGWYSFKLNNRLANLIASVSNLPLENFQSKSVMGYLIGDHIIPDDSRVELDLDKMFASSEKVFLIERGLDRFARIEAARVSEDGPLIFKSLAMPLGPEDDVLQAYLSQKTSVDHIKNVPPALDAAFRLETWRRAEAEKQRLEIARKLKEEEEQRAKEEKRKELYSKLGSGASRREMAKVDFGAAATAALAVSGAEYLDHMPAYNANEMVVRFRFRNQRFECTCDARTLRIIDAGICLSSGGVRGDTRFTLESLPVVISEALRNRVLVVLRHIDRDLQAINYEDDYDSY